MKMYLPPPGKKGSRRSFLKRGLFGGLALALGGGGWLAFRRSAEVRPPEGLEVLDAREYAVIAALMHRFVPHRQGFPTPEDLGTAKAVDHILSMVDDSARLEMKQLLMLFENALPNFLFGARTKPFTQLSVDEQDTVLQEWATSRLTLRRSGFLALRSLIMAAYYGNPATWSAVKYPGPPPGIFEPSAPVWKGNGVPRPVGRGTWVEPPPGPPSPGSAAGSVGDGGVP